MGKEKRMSRVMTKYQMEVDPDSLESLKGMILHDSFMIDIGNSMGLRVVRVIGGLLYVDRDASMVFTPFGNSFTKEYEQK